MIIKARRLGATIRFASPFIFSVDFRVKPMILKPASLLL